MDARKQATLDAGKKKVSVGGFKRFAASNSWRARACSLCLWLPNRCCRARRLKHHELRHLQLEEFKRRKAAAAAAKQQAASGGAPAAPARKASAAAQPPSASPPRPGPPQPAAPPAQPAPVTPARPVARPSAIPAAPTVRLQPAQQQPAPLLAAQPRGSSAHDPPSDHSSPTGSQPHPASASRANGASSQPGPAYAAASTQTLATNPLFGEVQPAEDGFGSPPSAPGADPATAAGTSSDLLQLQREYGQQVGRGTP